MELLLLGTVAFVVSAVTLFSGFGLGTVMTPVFALFLPVPLAVAATATVHLANNLLKFALLVRDADLRVVLRFGVPAAAAAFVGAAALALFDTLPDIARYDLGGRVHRITPLGLVIGAAIVGFALLDLSDRLQKVAFSARWLVPGGLLSGFFGGLSGNQGALRSAFLVRAGLSKEAFVATGVVTAVMVDTIRLLVYGATFLGDVLAPNSPIFLPVAVATLGAFAGTVLGRRLLEKVTVATVRWAVAVMMLVVGLGLMTGLV